MSTPPGAIPSATTWPAVLATLASGADLASGQAEWAMEQVLGGSASPAQFGAFVMGLRAKGETADEVEALVATMLAHARLLDFGAEGAPVALDAVGTGGDQAHTVNISTMTALVCAAAGVPMVKHGNRAASSSTGSADVLEYLGVVIDLEPEQVVESIRGAGIGFCFAQVHHPALRHAGPWRRELGVPTVLNILGPLTNPGSVSAALIGSASLALAPVMADVLLRRGVRALVVRGEDGLDEISTSAPTRVWDATGDIVRETTLDPMDFGIPRTPAALLAGGDSARNADLLIAALDGSAPQGPDADRVAAIRDAVTMNAAAALAAYAAATPGGDPGANAGIDLTARVAEHVPTVRAILQEGAAVDVLRRWAEVTQGLR
jgi:anthranilate phosphoribosyltransferase